jgi:hypothetical protein
MRIIFRKMQYAMAVLALAALVQAVLPKMLVAQDLTSATITGQVVDASGASVPNATVSVSSPALQVPVVQAATDADGNFRIVNLPAPGVYRVTFEAQGFGRLVRPGVQLTVGFTAKLDTALTVGAVSDTVEVNSAGPVIDVVSTVGSSTINQQEIQDTPKGLGLQELLPMAAGVSTLGKPDVGDSNLALKQTIQTYGVVLQPTLNVEGINTSTSKVASSSVYLDAMALAEVEFKTSGNNAEVAFPASPWKHS